MSKSTYNNLITVPGAATDKIVDDDETVIGGDLVKNFKAVADVIYPTGTTGNQALNVGCNFKSSDSKSFHILNNTGKGASTNSAYTSDGYYTYYGMQSGAFMKGVMIDATSGTSTTLLDVPYAGGMLVEWNLLAIDQSNILHIYKGTLKVYPSGLTTDSGSDDIYSIGYFSVSNGDLTFNVSSGIYGVNTIQLGLHGTILAGYTGCVNSDQSNATSLPSSSTWSGS